MSNITVTMVVGVAVALGGFVGFARKGSKASLIAGSIAGGLLGVSAVMMERDPAVGYPLALASSGLLAVVMGSRALKSGKFMPGGLVASLSGFAFLLNAYVFFGH